MRFADLKWLGLLAAVLFGPAAASADDPWWNSGWPYRRMASVEPFEPTGLGGDDLAVVTMPTGGLTARDGRDIRVATAGGTEVARRVLRIGPGDLVTVAFALRPTVRRYYVYFGNADAPQPQPLEVRRGVLLETYVNPGGPIDTFQDVQAAFTRASVLMGRDMRKVIFQGHNTFGPMGNVASLYTGALLCPRPGRYIFATSSRGASFLAIDGQVVVRNGGQHNPQHDARMQGQIELPAGLHTLTFYHVCPGGDPIAVAAWQGPDDEKIRPIPVTAFAPFLEARCGAMEARGAAVTLDFLFTHGGETFIADRYYQRFGFEAMACGAPAGVAGLPLQWDFGDGIISAGPSVQHVYLRPGMYTVTLSARTAGGVLTRVNRVDVARPWDRVISNKLDEPASYAAIVANYDFSAMDPRDLAEALTLLGREGRTDAQLRAGQAVLARRPMDPIWGMPVALRYVGLLVEQDRRGDAIAALLAAAEISPAGQVKAALATHAGRLAYEGGDYDRAMELFQQVIDQYKATVASGLLRPARIGIGDVWRARGQGAKAAEIYESVSLSEQDLRRPVALARGDFARQAEARLEAGQLEEAGSALDAWAAALPGDTLEGYWSSLRAQWQLAKGDGPEAAREAEILAAASPDSPYAPGLLMLAADVYRSAGQADRAKAVLRRVIGRYGDSPQAPQARRSLQMLEATGR